MKSHVKENIAKNFINNGYSFDDLGNGIKAVRFSPFILSIIEEKCNGFLMKGWKLYEDQKIWEAVAVKTGGNEVVTVRGSGINEVIEEAKRTLFS